ncbi:MAG: phenylalanine--tRNA ligase subunit alpha [Lactobacillaceae bacterium]|jgi:phenylalanyl-tRNA synthetase alpha chain|nr:phenylalanine--tRNA ligase subunit alpha [Lactobacillaceae bacterium]
MENKKLDITGNEENLDKALRALEVYRESAKKVVENIYNSPEIKAFQKAIQAIRDSKSLEDIRVSVLGKKGTITEMMKNLGSLSVEEKKEMGKNLNILKSEVEKVLEEQKSVLEESELDAKLIEERIDVTLPVRPENQGRIHPVSKIYEEVVAIFGQMGFSVAEGPDIEEDFYNFTALNIPANHPARQMHDTFYLPKEKDGGKEIDDSYVIRTHTSPVQIRTMEKGQPPIRIIAPGRTYRSDYDATHTPMFHQVEGLVIDKNITMAHLKGCLYDFVKAFFELDEIPVRYRPSFFPFTEPSAEMDIGCLKTKNEIKIGGGDDWLEILGCGMVHPNVLRAGGIDPDEYQGFAFGVGMDRLAMLKYGIPDLRTFFESDVRWLKNYGFAPLDESSMTGGLSNNGGITR